MSGLRFEAWDLPTAATFTRKIADVPVIVGSGKGYLQFGDSGRGQISVPSDYDRLSEIVSATTGSLIRVYDGVSLVHEWITERVKEDVADASKTVISGPDVQALVKRAVIYAFDYPVGPPTNDPDWLWGDDNNLLLNGSFEIGTNLVSNDGFEDGTTDPWWAGAVDGVSATLAIETTTVDAGTFSAKCDVLLSEGGMSTTLGGLYGSQTYTVTVRVQGTVSKTLQVGVSSDSSTMGVGTADRIIELTGFFEGTFEVQKDATATGAFQTITFTFVSAPGQTDAQLNIRDISGTPAAIFVDLVTVGGFGVGMDPWVPRNKTTTFEGSTDVAADDGSFVGKVTAQDGHGMTTTIQNIIPGATYSATIKVRNTSGSARWGLELKDNLGFRYDQATVATTTAFQTLTVTGRLNLSARWIVLEFINFSGGTATVYMDTGEVFRGQPAATVGDILIQLFDDAQTDHSADPRGTLLTWLDTAGFDATNDSNTSAWASTIAFTAHWNDDYMNVMRHVRRLSYEWNVTAKASPSAGNTHDLNVYEPGGLGTDYSAAATPSIVYGMGTTDADLVQRIPNYTAVLAQGEDGLWAEDEDATAQTNFGRWEKGTRALEATSATELGTHAAELLTFEADNRLAARVKLEATPDHPRPLVDYTVGDTLQWQVPPTLAREARQVLRISYRNTEPNTYDVTGSSIYDPEAGLAETVKRLTELFDPLRRRQTPPQASPVPESGGDGTVPTVFVAASDARQKSIDNADFVCDGTDDQVEIQAAIDLLTVGGRVLLSEGAFSIAAPSSGAAITLTRGVSLQGLGSGLAGAGTILTQLGTGGAANVRLLRLLGDSLINNLRIVTLGDVDGILVQDLHCTIEYCAIEPLNGHGIDMQEGDVTIRNNRISVGGAGHGIFSDGLAGERHVVIDGNLLLGATGYGIRFDGAGVPLRATIVNNNFDCGTGGGIYLDDASDSMVANNLIRSAGSTLHGVRLTDASGVVIANNRIVDSVGSNTNDGIFLDGNSDNNLITGNKIDGDASLRYGINVSAAACDDNAVSGNYLSGTFGTAEFNDAGTGTLFGPEADKWNVGELSTRTTSDFIQWDGSQFVLTTVTTGGGSDTDAIHDNVAAEISVIAEKTTPITADLLVIEDSADTNNKKRLQIGNIPDGDSQSLSDPGTATSSGTHRLYFKDASTITNVSAALGTAPTGSTYIVDVHKNTTTIFPTQANRPTIAISGFQDDATLETTAITAGQFLTVDIDQVGSTITGADLTVTINWTTP